RDDDRAMDGARQADVDCFDVGAADESFWIVHRFGAAERGGRTGVSGIAREHTDHPGLFDTGPGGGMHRSHGTGAQDADADHPSQPAAFTRSRKLLLTGTCRPLRSTRVLRPLLRSTEATAPLATHQERWTCRPRSGPSSSSASRNRNRIKSLPSAV